MLLLAAVALIAGPQASAPPAQPLTTTNCPRTTNYYAWKTGKPLKPYKLTELPPGHMYVAVFRRDANGCEAPIVVKYGLGR